MMPQLSLLRWGGEMWDEGSLSNEHPSRSYSPYAFFADVCAHVCALGPRQWEQAGCSTAQQIAALQTCATISPWVALMGSNNEISSEICFWSMCAKYERFAIILNLNMCRVTWL